ncbi:MAG TPA: hypothetical protein VD902_09585 [Symbiobacteriaceae bacterium]|nr:hypothetical protein [Symbiobacteriaceae bacterium]
MIKRTVTLILAALTLVALAAVASAEHQDIGGIKPTGGRVCTAERGDIGGIGVTRACAR